MEFKFVGSSLKINPLVTLISIYAGIKIYGAWGIIFGPIMVILFKELYNVIIIRCELPITWELGNPLAVNYENLRMSEYIKEN